MSQSTSGHAGEAAADRPSSPALVALAWLIVVVPLAYGLYETLVKAAQLLTGG